MMDRARFLMSLLLVGLAGGVLAGAQDEGPLILKVKPSEKSRTGVLLDELQGRWKMTRYVHKGKESKEVSNEMEIVHNQVYYLRNGQRILRAVFVIDAGRPGQIEHILVLQDDERPLREPALHPGIYCVQAKQLTICINGGGGDRPTELAPGTKWTFSVWERVK